MTYLHRIEKLPDVDRVKAYSDLAAHFCAMAELSHTDGVKLTFVEMAQEMYGRATAAAEFSSQTTR
jgi:hypothetical protein